VGEDNLMATKTHVRTDFRVYSPGPAYTVPYRGLGGYLSFKQHEIAPIGVEYKSNEDYLRAPIAFDELESVIGNACDTAYFGADGQMRAPTLKQVTGALGGLMLYPHLEKTASHTSKSTVTADPQLIDLNCWKPMNKYDDRIIYWSDGYDGSYLSYQHWPRIIFRDGTYPEKIIGLESRFRLPEFPVFCFGLWREDYVPPTTWLSGVSYGTGDRVFYSSESHPNRVYRSLASENLNQIPPNALNEWWEDAGSTNYVAGTFVTFCISGPDSPDDFKYQLYIPYIGEMKLYHKNSNTTNGNWQQLRKIDGNVEASGDTVGQWEGGQEIKQGLIWVGWFGNMIAVSTDGFGGSTAYFSVQVSEPGMVMVGETVDDDDPTQVTRNYEFFPCGDTLPTCSSPVRIEHTGGKWEFCWVPVYCADIGMLYSPMQRTPYDTNDHTASSVPEAKTYQTIGHRVIGGWDTGEGDVRLDGGVSTQMLSDLETRAYREMIYGGYGASLRFGYDYKLVLERGHWSSSITGDYEWADNILAYPNRTVGAYHHDITPVVLRVDHWLDTVINENTTRTYVDIVPENIKSVRYERGEPGGNAAVGVEGFISAAGTPAPLKSFIDNTATQGTREVTISPVTVYGGSTENANVYTPGFGGMTYGPEVSIQGGKVSAAFQASDFLNEAMSVVLEGTIPPFDWWPVRDVVEWLLDYVGIGANQRKSSVYNYINGGVGGDWQYRASNSTIEDLGTCLNGNTPGDPLWVGEVGRPAMDLLAEVCLYDWGAGLWCQNGAIWKGCPFCRAIRTSNGYPYDQPAVDDSATNFTAHLKGPTSDGCIAYDKVLAAKMNVVAGEVVADATNGIHYQFVMNQATLGNVAPFSNELLSIRNVAMDIKQEFYNSVQVRGASTLNPNQPIVIEKTDWPSVRGIAPAGTYDGYLLGYKKQLKLQYEWIKDNTVARWVLNSRYYNARRYRRYVDITCPYFPDMSIGQVFSVTGATADCAWANGQKFRIVGGVGMEYNAGQPPLGGSARGVWIGAV
jgi:hypothetical protein